MAKIFISYRRTDSAASSGRIYDRLVSRFKRKNVFKDVDDIPAGVDFGSYIQQSLRECAVVLVVIGPRWLGARADDSSRRLENPADWVRVEIETALALGLTVIPLLVEGAAIPKAADLPDSLRELARLNALPVRNDPDFSHDMERVIAAVERAIGASRPTPGIFRRGVASRPTPKQPILEQPARPDQAELLPQPDPTPAHVMSPATVTVVEPAASRILPKQPPASGSPGKSRARRVTLVAVAVVLVVASIAVLLSRGIIPVGAGRRVNQQATRTAPVAIPTATSTPAALLPLTLRLPGPEKCADASGQPAMELAWTTYATGEQDYDCTSGPATRLYAGACNSCGFDGRFDFNIQSAGLTLPDTYTVSVMVSNLTRGTDAHFVLVSATNGFAYDFAVFNDPNITGTTYYEISSDQCPGSQPCASGSFNVNKTNTLAFHVAGTSVTASLNGKQVMAAQTATTPLFINGVTFGVSVIPLKSGGGIGYTGRPYYVDFSNFTIKPS